MQRLFPLLALALGCLSFGGCFQATVDVQLYEPGDGSIAVELALDRGKIPAFFGDPLAGVGTPEDLRRYSGPGIVAWAETVRGKRGSWETVTLRAYFDDINKLRFLRERDDGEVYELLHFEYGQQDQVALIHDLTPELSQPMPIPERPDSKIDPEMMRSAVGMLKPMLGDLQLQLRVRVPGRVESAPGFHRLDGNTAILLAGRDPVLQAIDERAGALLDEAAFLAARPPVIRWAAGQTPAAERRKFEAARAAALEWWATQRNP